MRIRPSLVVTSAVLLGSLGAQVQAQRTAAALVLTEGTVYLNDQSVDATATPSALPDTVVVRTAGHRAVVALKRGGWLFLDAASSARVFHNGVYNFNRIEMLTGSAIVASETSSPIVACENEMRLSTGGIFRFDVQDPNARNERYCRFRVFEGAAAVPLVSVTNALRAGQTMMCNRRCGDMVQTNEFSREQLDEFDQWARRMVTRLRP
jgi:hypothetical protein